MQDETPRRFLEALPTPVDPERVPLGYALLTANNSEAPYYAAAPSDHHRSRAYLCFPYYKPISRSFRPG
ncbi:MAG TPA: hypothetical protein VFR37_00875 [Longimicrobium sp.]|nr:hypothetical protein [Longimicrobium sp.]